MDTTYMKMALDLAKRAKGQTSPNPLVGAVVVKNGEVVGFGAHLKAGEGHAEVHALAMAGDKAEDSTLYVTLEPCSHFGKTPPCANLVIEKKVKKVVIATMDPNPQVAGKGVARLREAGIEVEIGMMKAEADELNAVFFHYIATKRPFVTIKSASSLDGKTSTYKGESKWITSEEARMDTHRYRHEHDAILVGVNTIITDDPSLTTRLPGGGKNPIRIVLDTQLRTPLTSKIVNDREAETWIITSETVDKKRVDEFSQKNVSIVQLNGDTISIPTLLDWLGQKEITSLFVEGGATINGSFLVNGCINQVITYIAPKIIGGKMSPTTFGGEGIARIKDVMNLKIKSVETIGEDIKIISVPKEVS